MTTTAHAATPLVEDAIYTEAQAAEYLRMGRTGLRSRRCRGDDVPRWFLIGNRVMYRGTDIRVWVDRKAAGSPRK